MNVRCWGRCGRYGAVAEFPHPTHSRHPRTLLASPNRTLPVAAALPIPDTRRRQIRRGADEHRPDGLLRSGRLPRSNRVRKRTWLTAGTIGDPCGPAPVRALREANIMAALDALPLTAPTALGGKRTCCQGQIGPVERAAKTAELIKRGRNLQGSHRVRSRRRGDPDLGVAARPRPLPAPVGALNAQSDRQFIALRIGQHVAEDGIRIPGRSHEHGRAVLGITRPPSGYLVRRGLPRGFVDPV